MFSPLNDHVKTDRVIKPILPFLLEPAEIRLFSAVELISPEPLESLT